MICIKRKRKTLSDFHLLTYFFFDFFLQDSGAGSSLDEDEPIKTNRR